jgi:radical SAM superfamily enzyme YgiQ (UPF0313 family)
VRRSILLDAKADLLLYGNAERALVAAAHRIAAGEPVSSIDDLRGTAFARQTVPADWIEIDSTTLDTPGELAPPVDPYASEAPAGSRTAAPARAPEAGHAIVRFARQVRNADRALYQAKSSGIIGKRRIRLPVAAKIALHSAGANGGTPGSPTPAGGASLSTR